MCSDDVEFLFTRTSILARFYFNIPVSHLITLQKDFVTKISHI